MHHEFLQAVLAHPDEDAPRLIYADWLEEQGDSERAEFIRIQCELENLTYEEPGRVGMVRRKIELERACEASWLSALLPPSIKPRPGYEFRRGFVEYLQIDVKSFLAHAETLIEHTPLRHVEFTRVRNRVASLARSSALLRLRQIDILMEPLEPGDVAALIQSPQLRGLATLRLQGNHLTTEHLAALTNSEALASLQVLDLSFNRFGAEGVKSLVAWPVLAHLAELRLYGCGLRDEGAAALARCPRLKHLRLLDLGGNAVTAEAVQTMAAASHWPALEDLILDNNSLSAAGARHLLRATALAGLKRLYLTHNRTIHPTSAAALRRESDKVIV